jgi:DNA invertase Pin-like site-specific DNA recombinase
VSSLDARAQLEAALDYVREGDAFIVTKLDRLTRSVAHLCRITDPLEKKGVALRILDIGVDTGTLAGWLFLNMLGSPNKTTLPKEIRGARNFCLH